MTELPTTLFERLGGARAPVDLRLRRRHLRTPRRARQVPAHRRAGRSRGRGQPLPGGGRPSAPEKTVIIPTADRHRPLRGRSRPRPARGRDVVVGWTGLSGNYRQLGARGARHRARARADGRPVPRHLRSAAAASRSRRCAPSSCPGAPETEVEDLARIDVGVMPLPDDAYARGKCAFKLLQYMALARPGVASPVGANPDVVTRRRQRLPPRRRRRLGCGADAAHRGPRPRGSASGRAGRARVEAAYSLAVRRRPLQGPD